MKERKHVDQEICHQKVPLYEDRSPVFSCHTEKTFRHSLATLFHNKKFPNSPLIAVGFPIHWSREGITTKACNKFGKPLNGLHAINPKGIHRYSWHTTHTPFLTLVADGLEGCFDNSESFQGVLGSQVKNHYYKTCIMYSAKTKSQEFCLFIGYHRKHTYQPST